jgi:hypothetical protein
MDCIGLVRDILTDELAVPVATDMPKDRPTRMVMVDLEGDASDEFILRPRVAITCWGRTDRDAHGLAVSAVQALQDASLDHDYLSAAQLETLSREEWSRTGQSRYLAIVELVINTDE